MHAQFPQMGKARRRSTRPIYFRERIYANWEVLPRRFFKDPKKILKYLKKQIVRRRRHILKFRKLKRPQKDREALEKPQED